ncbi:cobyrinic acid a,c-diamide synthase [Rhodothalassium salexigens]|uniref:Cellulose biosynthesis protein BcsQ n=1 Tax=Rhodothalassium salexigens DSM 2132 TaxID=1188247 RepID=A0A4R2PHI2_RHOSA|nr:ParA family protein [Rhodothalassium salexigens]MBB4211704.1 cellulose biosynthesis protein BcsQ [Rhodothalassium salexigens DSM 2132]MBK1638987.1 cobyrinic acid a,c-diamide synthase [Rhodothalassium salexigens DSM 2132]MBK5911516.1 cobyrinic acid a,c-diamide synthase [Rhodothalassium salexigens]MBK5919657.1 cobyrinic acid a,c-diamide synthase [Rhodothalassium salexigens]TCP33998.1 cellulose biosynthesis protein BcsQ [Rhodothalassium salexigens DSM 2132]
MKVLAIHNIKGGVGKTAAAVNLAYEAAGAGARTLVWDLDPQAATSFYFRIKPKVKGGGKGIVKGKTELDDRIKGTDFDNLDLMPADFSYREFDAQLDATDKTNRLAKALKPLASQYDFVFLDCPPSISHLSENVFAAAHGLVIPLLPTTLSLRTYDQLCRFLDERRISPKRRLPFLSMIDRRKTLHRDVMTSFPAQHKEALATGIPYSSVVERMGLERAPVRAFAPRSAAARAFADLWDEIATRVG